MGSHIYAQDVAVRAPLVTRLVWMLATLNVCLWARVVWMWR